jgi:hypothetical protein
MALIDSIMAALEQWLEQLHDPSIPTANDPSSMASMELQAQALGKRIAQLALSDLLGNSGTGYSCSVRPCHCGAKQ